MSIARFVPGLLAACALVGCGGAAYKVSVVTEPPGAPIVLARGDEAFPSRARPTPYDARFTFNEQTREYRLLARPQGRLAETHLPTEVRVTKALLDELGTRPISIELDERSWIDMRTWELMFDPVLGWRGVETKHRAHTSQAESNGVRPEKIAVLVDEESDDYDGFRGVNLSPDGQSLVFATFSLRPIDPLPSPKERRAREERGEDPSSWAPQTQWMRRIQHSHLRMQFVESQASDYLLREGVHFDPAFVNDGEGVLWVSDTTGEGHSRMQVKPKLDGIIIAPLPDGETGEASFYPGFFPGEPGQQGTYVFSVISDGAARLADARIKLIIPEYPRPLELRGLTGVHPRLSPTGGHIAYIEEGELRVVAKSGTGVQRFEVGVDAEAIRDRYRASISDSDEDVERWERYERDHLFLANAYPAWSPDGDWLLYTSMEAADETGRPQEDIWAIDRQTGAKKLRITTNLSADRMPMMSPDGRWIYFVSNRGKEWAVWRLPTPAELR